MDNAQGLDGDHAQAVAATGPTEAAPAQGLDVVGVPGDVMDLARRLAALPPEARAALAELLKDAERGGGVAHGSAEG